MKTYSLKILIVVMLIFTVECFDGPDVIEGVDVNVRIQQAFFAKGVGCGIFYPGMPLEEPGGTEGAASMEFTFFMTSVMLTGNPDEEYTGGKNLLTGICMRCFYLTKDVDKCLEPLDFMNCQNLRDALQGPNYNMIFGIPLKICSGLRPTTLFQPPYFQGDLIPEQSSDD